MSLSPPSGDVTLMFTDIEGSTKAWDKYKETFREALNVHNTLMRQAIERNGGYEVKTIGDSFMVAFDSPLSAACCALDMQKLIEAEPFTAVGGMRVRIGLHTGQLEPYGGDYFGPVVNHTARIESSGNGGQTVLSEETARRIEEELPAGTILSDDGLHRLKDLGAPIRLFLLGHETLPQRDYPQLRTLDILPHNFPAQVTSFVGRERECEEVIRLLTQKARLITLTGPGGTGKTRLSMQVAAESVQHYPDGIWLVELAGLTDSREVPSALALALKIPLASEKSVPEQIFAYLKEKKCLLVLDNFEQVVDAATFVGNLLKQCRNIVCLVTSQHLLQIAGETEYPLKPLDLPPANVTLENCFRYASVQLFVERAQAAKPQFTLTEETLPAISEICRRLEGLPLAVELTAALVRGMTPNQILPRLQDRFKLLASSRRDLDPRQRSLRGALDWSYELLSEDERALFAELSIFAGGFFVEDVEAVSTVLDCFMLTIALRDKSLLKTEEVQGETRYFMLETLRAYAGEKLAMTDNAVEVKNQHARHYLEKAQEWSAQLDSSGEAMQRMIAEIDNMRTGMDWAIEQEDTNTIIGYGRALAKFFVTRGLYEEGDRRLALAEEFCRRNNDNQTLAQLLLQHGTLAYQISDLVGATQRYLESYSVCQQLNDEARIVPILINLGNVAWDGGEFENARTKWLEGLELSRKTQQPRYEASLLQNLSLLAGDQGNFEEAKDYLEQSIAMHRKSKNHKSLAFAIFNYGEMLCLQKQYKQAIEKLEESRQLFLDIGYDYSNALISNAISVALLEDGALSDARYLAEQGHKASKETGNRRFEMISLTILGRIEGFENNLSAARDFFCRSAEIAKELKNNRDLSDIFYHYGKVLIHNNRPNEAYPLILAAYREYNSRGLYAATEAGDHLEQLKGCMEQASLELLANEANSSADQMEIGDLIGLLEIAEIR